MHGCVWLYWPLPPPGGFFPWGGSHCTSRPPHLLAPPDVFLSLLAHLGQADPKALPWRGSVVFFTPVFIRMLCSRVHTPGVRASSLEVLQACPTGPCILLSQQVLKRWSPSHPQVPRIAVLPKKLLGQVIYFLSGFSWVVGGIRCSLALGA